MFGMSWGEIIIIVTVGMFVLGPERIPVAVKWVGSTLKTVRTMAAGAQEQLQGEFGPELEELKRQIADLQSLKEIQELRSLRDLNPRSLITKNILGEEFSGGLTGMLGLKQPTAGAQATGSGVAAQPAPVEPAPVQPEPSSESNEVASSAAPVEAAPAVMINEPVINQPVINEPVVMTKSAVPSDEPATGTSAATWPGSTIDMIITDDLPDSTGPTDAEHSSPRHLAAATFDTDAT